ncbi:MarR family winged helix-turn-helix transcriptional regulator [Paenibacillus flagellatus]|uniref:MarR family transcriptional regulator n=1 Tax=Paenibacillus flagellatus TaxID=2211139 RepID=A0A2V5KZI8_9BACL|nr:MarR family transcriptional regulator [Paenibacillus flagellatus]PYI55566.1 MarR family transcriptional regulator [Paenibacillus flagellatus]
MERRDLFQKFVAFTTAVHQTTHEMTKDVKSGSITPMQYSILEYIAVSQPVTLSQISDCQHMSMPNASRELKKLSEKRLCEKVAVAEDRRKQYIRLTEAGEAMMSEAFARIEARFRQRISHLSEEELVRIDQAIDVLMSKVFDSNR